MTDGNFETFTLPEELADIVPEMADTLRKPPPTEEQIAEAHRLNDILHDDGAADIADLFDVPPDIDRVLTDPPEAAGQNTDLPNAATPPAPDALVPENGSNGIAVPVIFQGLAHYYGKDLTAQEIRRTIDGFRESLASLGSPFDAELAEIYAKGEENWTDEDSKRAGEIRRYYKTVRTKAEATRKALKHKSLRTGQLIDGEGNALKEYCSKREERAEAVEKVNARRLAAERARLAEAREIELSPFVESVKPFDLGGMNEEAYQILLTGSKAAFEQRERERIAREQQEQEAAALEAAKRQAAEMRAERARRLSATGFSYDPDNQAWVYEDLISLSDAALDEYDDLLFDTFIEQKGAYIAERKAAIEAARQREAEALAAAKAEEEARAAQAAAAATAPDGERLVGYFQDVLLAAQRVPSGIGHDAEVLVGRFFDEHAALVNRYATEAEGL